MQCSLKDAIKEINMNAEHTDKGVGESQNIWQKPCIKNIK